MKGVGNVFLVLNEEMECNQKINKEEFRENLFVDLTKDNLYYEKLVSTFTSNYSVSPTGNVECDLLDDCDYELDLYKNIYIVKNENDDLIIERKLTDSEYINIAIDLMMSSGNRDNLFDIAEVLKGRVVNEEDLVYILGKISGIVKTLNGDEYGFMYLFRTLDEIIPDTYFKKNYMETLCDCFIKDINIIGLVTDEDKLYLERSLNKYYTKEYDKNILEDLTVEDIPF